MSDELIIGGVAMPTLKLSGLTVTKEKSGLKIPEGRLTER